MALETTLDADRVFGGLEDFTRWDYAKIRLVFAKKHRDRGLAFHQGSLGKKGRMVFKSVD
jgi:hypothetical protein